MDPTKMFPTNQPPTLLRVQPEMQCAPMRGSMYPMHIPKLHRTMEKSFPPPYPFILRSARNADAPMYPAVRQTQWSNIQMNPIHISRNGKHRMLCVSPEIILIMLPKSKKPAKVKYFCRLIFSINPFLFSWKTISLHLPRSLHNGGLSAKQKSFSKAAPWRPFDVATLSDSVHIYLFPKQSSLSHDLP